MDTKRDLKITFSDSMPEELRDEAHSLVDRILLAYITEELLESKTSLKRCLLYVAKEVKSVVYFDEEKNACHFTYVGI